MKRLANFPLYFGRLLAAAILLLAIPVGAAQLVNVTGNGVELTYVSVDCAGQNEVGVVVSGAGFVGKHIASQNCAGGAYSFSGATPTLTNSLGLSAGADVTIAAGVTLTGTYNLFGDAARAGTGTYLDGSSTTLWSSTYDARIDAGAPLWTYAAHPGDVNGDKVSGARPDIGAVEDQQELAAPTPDLFFLSAPDLCESTDADCYNAE